MTTDEHGWCLFEHLTPGPHSWRIEFDALGIPNQFPAHNLYC